SCSGSEITPPGPAIRSTAARNSFGRLTGTTIVTAGRMPYDGPHRESGPGGSGGGRADNEVAVGAGRAPEPAAAPAAGRGPPPPERAAPRPERGARRRRRALESSGTPSDDRGRRGVDPADLLDQLHGERLGRDGGDRRRGSAPADPARDAGRRRVDGGGAARRRPGDTRRPRPLPQRPRGAARPGARARARRRRLPDE